VTLRYRGVRSKLAALAGAVALVIAMPQPATAQPSVPEGGPLAPQQAGLAAGAGLPSQVDFEAESDTGNWIVQLAEPPLARYAGGIAGLPATSPAVTGAARLDVTAPASTAYLDHLAGEQADFAAAMDTALGRTVDVPFAYRNVLNGMAVTVSADEAARLARLPGVVSVRPDTERELETDTSHFLIGSPSFWDGQTGPGLATRGEGVVVAMLDTGVNAFHPAFAGVSPGDGFAHENPFGSGNFVGACDPAHPAHQAVCNDKLIGAYNLHLTGPNFPSVLDWNDHGSHVGSTIAGNLHDATFSFGPTEFTRTVQGVAPRANVISYLICDPQCPSSSAVAAVDQAIADGVDVINYSISGVDDPWVDPVDQAFLDAFEAGLFVSASAGNDGPGTVAKTGPWNASVAASTHRRIFAHTVDVTGTAPPPELTGLAGVPGDGPQVSADIAAEIRFDPANQDGCVAFAAGTFTDSIALIQRGACTFATKVNNATAAGAVAVVLFNNQGGPPVSPGGLAGTAAPAVMLERPAGEDLRDHILANDPTEAVINAAAAVFEDPAWEDVMAGFSSTGPSQFELLAPTFTAPGVNVLAAAHDPGGDPVRYTLLQGTSMSSPHGAGSGALLTALHPDWTPAQVRSALAATADPDGVQAPDGDTPATQFNFGSGRLDLTGAARVGLTLDETTANFEAADPSLGGDPKTLNLPAFIDHSCAVCGWDRTLTSVADAPASYTAVVDAPAGMAVTLTPSAFTIAPGATQDIQVTVDATGLPTGEWAFADVQLVTADSHAGGQPIASVHYPVGVIAAEPEAAEITVDPAEITAVQGPDEVVTHELTIGNLGDAALDWSVFENQPQQSPVDGSTPVGAGPAPGTPEEGASLSHRRSLLRGVFRPPAPETVTPATPAPAQDEVTITHSQSQSIVELNSVACSPDAGVSTTENGYLRHFTLADFGITDDFDVTEVSFGIENLSIQQTVTVNLFRMIDPAGPFVYANFESIGSTDTTLPAQQLTIAEVPVTGTAPAGSTLVVEVDLPDMSGVGAFFIGSNPDGQTAPSYLRSASCGLVEPTDLAQLGIDDMHIVMNVTGTTGADEPECAVPSGTPWVGVDPLAGTVAPGGTQVVGVTFDSTGLAVGDLLQANLCLASNDPANPLVVVPLTLQVEDVATPVIEVSPESLSAEQATGEVTEQILTIGNTGDATLDWDIFADEPERLPSAATPVQPAAESPETTLVGYDTSLTGVAGTRTVPEAGPQQAEEVTITHSTSPDIVALNSVACSPDAGATTTENGYLRHFVLPDFEITSDFDVTSVSFGVETINGPPHPVTVNLFRMVNPAGTFTYGNFELIGTAQQDLSAQQMTIVEMPVAGTAPAGSTLVVEVETPDFSGIGSFFIGSNPDGQTAPSYLRSASCGLTEPFDTATIGFPGMHIVMSVTGTIEVEAPVCDGPGDVPWLSVSPESGSTAPGGTSEVTVSFDATGLEPGDYQAVLCVASNDPVTPLVQVPVSLTVVEDAGGICDVTILGVHDGPLTVTEGTTCLAAGSQVLGEVNVAEGAGLIATAAVIQGPLSAVGASLLDLAFTQVTGPVLVLGATGSVSMFASQVTGSVSLLNGVTAGPTTVSGNTIIGTLSCFGNQPPPTDHGLPNTATGGKLGQCADL
jgi:subtilisin family serine protease